jgi:putative ABC transport system ATP-binding protein
LSWRQIAIRGVEGSYGTRSRSSTHSPELSCGVGSGRWPIVTSFRSRCADIKCPCGCLIVTVVTLVLSGAEVEDVMAGAQALFALEDVTVRRGGALLLDRVTCQVPAGTCTAVTGPSGAGKTTLLRLLNRLDEPDSGRVLLEGRPLPDLDVLALRRRVALVTQAPVLLAGRVLDELRVGQPRLAGDEAAGLLDQVSLPPAMLARGTAGLSGGEAQRLCLARALAAAPQVLLLDEPTSALDMASKQAVEQAARSFIEDGGSVVLVSHDLGQASRLAGRVLVLRAGQLTAAGPAPAASLREVP